MEQALPNKIEVKVKSIDALTYPVYVENNLELWQQEILPALTQYSRYFLITERGLPKALLHSFLEGLRHLFPLGMKDPNVIFLQGGEACKSSKKLISIYDYLIRHGIDRQSCLFALGGGVVGDFTGFVAASLLRGIDYIQIPTTFLAAVDSSVGGKVAVNSKYGKNMIGAFHHPRLVYLNTGFFHTLTRREWICGLAELYKHSLIEENGSLLQKLDDYGGALYEPGSADLAKAIIHSIKIKACFVWEDEKERGLRQALNFGHTTAHALEALSRYSLLSHGEAVARGLVTALLLSRNVCALDSDFVEECLKKMKVLGLPQDTCGYRAQKLYKHMRYDKKAQFGEPKFVLLKAPGKIMYKQSVTEKEFQEAWREQGQRFG